MATVGILGGLGAVAGAAFYQSLVSSTRAETDADHPGVVLLSDPGLPSRIDHLLGNGESPLPGLVRLVERMDTMGADVIAIPSGTTHAYYSQLQAACRAQIINLLDETAKALQADGVSRVALLSTLPTVRLKLYEPGPHQHYELTVPDPSTQADIDALISAIKAGRPLSQLEEWLADIVGRPWTSACDAILLGCTELHLVRRTLVACSRVFDATDILVAAVLRAIGQDAVEDASQACLRSRAMRRTA